MKFTRLMAIIGIALVLFSCGSKKYRLEVINSKSFPEIQITLDSTLIPRLVVDSFLPGQDKNIEEPNLQLGKIDELISLVKNVRETKSDSTWKVLSAKWEDFRANQVGPDGMPDVQSDIMTDYQSTSVARKWAEMNVSLLKLSGEMRFGDVLEKLLYKTKAPALSEKLLKSVIYTHIDDQIFINVIGSSSLNHHHTTGGTIQLIQKTDYPEGNDMTLKCECTDTRYLDVFIRIPTWAVNPTVALGNVKYVPHPGEYCQISRKWNNGDKIRVRLKN